MDDLTSARALAYDMVYNGVEVPYLIFLLPMLFAPQSSQLLYCPTKPPYSIFYIYFCIYRRAEFALSLVRHH